MKKLSFFLFTSLIVFACSKSDVDDNEINPTPVEGTEEPQEQVISISTVVNDFIWEGLNLYYYWQESVPNLADSMTDDETAYIDFLNSNTDSEAFFESLNHEDDRFSWIESDYRVLENQLAGISSTNGMRFSLHLRSADSNGIIAVVTYVMIGSDAETNGVQRGDIFNTVDGQELTVDNYRALLYGDNTSYTIELVNFDGNTNVITPRNESITLNKIENFQETPIHKSMVFEVSGRRVGYFMYNRFVGAIDNDGDGENEFDFNQEMIDVFSGFLNFEIQDLVLDLRYNGGGSTLTCNYLASMITGQFTGEIFAQQIWNSKIRQYIDSRNSDGDPNNDISVVDRFLNSTRNGVGLPGLNLPRVYVLTSNRTASASELLINGLASHIEVIQVGTTTVGKNEGSITLYDYIDSANSVRDTTHRYAMQPIVLKIANSVGFADYADGLPPEDGSLIPNLSFIEKEESPLNYGTLGDPSEPLLSLALGHIQGNSAKANKEAGSIKLPEIKVPYDSHLQRMIVEEFPNFKIKRSH